MINHTIVKKPSVQNNILPWHEKNWTTLLKSFISKQLPHALLLHGIRGVGKKYFSEQFMQVLACENFSNQTDTVCKTCHGCQLFLAGTHPDQFKLAPDGIGKKISIDAVRHLIEFVQTSSLISQYKVVLIASATSLNIYSVNALLKILEEPPANTIFILLCDEYMSLPATLLSRCQKIVFTLPDKEMALSWLKKNFPEKNIEELTELLIAANHAPLSVKELLTSQVYLKQTEFYQELIDMSLKKKHFIVCSQKWSEKSLSELISLRQWLDWLFMWVRAISLYPVSKKNVLLPFISQSFLIQIAEKISSHHLFDYLKYLQTIIQYSTVSHLNRQLTMDDLLLRWVTLCN